MTREEAIAYGLSFPDSYFDVPFHDPNWQLVRVKGSKKAFLWTYERDGHIHLNVKAQPGWLEFWRQTYESVVPGYHQDKNHWNTIILDGTVPEDEIKRMIAESYDMVTDSPTKRIYEAVKKFQRAGSQHTGRLLQWRGIPGCPAPWETHFIKIPPPELSRVTESSTPGESFPVPLLSAEKRHRKNYWRSRAWK